jgi:hypothetical protein
MTELHREPDVSVFETTSEIPREKALRQALEVADQIGGPKTAGPAIKFTLFNFFYHNPGYKEEDLKREIERLRH